MNFDDELIVPKQEHIKEEPIEITGDVSELVEISHATSEHFENSHATFPILSADPIAEIQVDTIDSIDDINNLGYIIKKEEPLEIEDVVDPLSVPTEHLEISHATSSYDTKFDTSGDATFQCPFCDFTSFTVSVLNEHIVINHQNSIDFDSDSKNDEFVKKNQKRRKIKSENRYSIKYKTKEDRILSDRNKIWSDFTKFISKNFKDSHETLPLTDFKQNDFVNFIKHLDKAIVQKNRRQNFMKYKLLKDAYKDRFKNDLETDFPELFDEIKVYFGTKGNHCTGIYVRKLEERKNLWIDFTDHVRKIRGFVQEDFINYFTHLKEKSDKKTQEKKRKELFDKFELLRDHYRDEFHGNIYKEFPGLYNNLKVFFTHSTFLDQDRVRFDSHV